MNPVNEVVDALTKPHSLTLGLTGSAANIAGGELAGGVYLSWDLSALKFDVGKWFSPSMSGGLSGAITPTLGYYDTFDISGRSGSLNGSVGPWSAGFVVDKDMNLIGRTIGFNPPGTSLPYPASGYVNFVTWTVVDSFRDKGTNWKP